jgi:ribosome-interacting GTPase 1
MLSLIPKHKGTDHLRADYRRQLSKLKSEAQTHKKTSAQPSAFRVAREGAGQAALVGTANAGKSSLLAALTNAEPEISEAPYPTWRPAPGMMDADGAPIQLIDTPPLDREYLEPELIDLIRRTDLLLLVVDLQADPIEELKRLTNILGEHYIITHESGATSPAGEMQAESRPTIYLPALVLANKCDDESLDELCLLFQEMMEGDWPVLAVSAQTGRNLERLKQAVFERLNLVRIYAKAPGKEPDLEAPFVLKKGSTVEELAAHVHKDFLEKLKFARVWGSSVFDGQMVQRDYVLQDGDIVELHI